MVIIEMRFSTKMMALKEKPLWIKDKYVANYFEVFNVPRYFKSSSLCVAVPELALVRKK